MGNFRSRLVLTLIGVIFINFFIVFIAFNVLVRQYIYTQAKNEINKSASFVMEPYQAGDEILSISSEIGGSFFAFGNLTQDPSLVNTQAIVLNADLLVDPSTETKSTSHEEEIQVLHRYYRENEEKFTNNLTVQVNLSESNYLMTLAHKTKIPGSPMLLYTNITPITNFANRINAVLLFILLISGIMAAFIGARMTKGFNKAVLALCLRAEKIGHGDFEQKQMQFHYTEFNQLSGSMDKMSSMLASYEDQQKIFFQNASHELRTPLMSIQGYAEGIREGVFEDTVQAANVIVDESVKMSGIVHELLYVSRMDSGLQKLQISEFDANDFLYECMERVSILAAKAGKKISFSATEQTVPLQGDREQLSRGILNILSNAIRHAEQNIMIDLTKQPKGIVISIQDDGCGINPADLPHVFERFYKGESGNYGLGLSIARDIVKAHGGTISVQNLTQGACFLVELP